MAGGAAKGEGSVKRHGVRGKHHGGQKARVKMGIARMSQRKRGRR